LAGHHGSINSVAFSSGAKHLASASDDETVKLWDLATGTVLQTFTGHENWVRSVAFSPDDRHLASASWDKTIRLWDLATGKLLRTLEGHRDWVCVVVFSADGSLLASGSDDGTARVWDANTGAPLHTLEGHTDWVRFAAFSPDSHQVVSASNDKTVRRWDTATGAELHVEAVSWMAFSANGKHLETNMGPYYLQTMATASSQQQIHIRGDWIYRGTERLLWLPQDYAATCSACSRDNLLALGHGSGWVSFLEFESLQSQV
jgi:WD40 repeat protein